VPELDSYLSLFAGKRAVEIGGPSPAFADDGSIPVYRVLGSVDNCLFSASTIWTGKIQEGKSYQYHPRKQPGLQLICEATNLKMAANASYDCLLAANCLEHIANPLKALFEWRGILNSDGLLLLILPHKAGTFDWRRPTTSLSHIVEDYDRDVGEDDLTHLSEVLALHDLKKDRPAGTMEQFRKRCSENYFHRAIHHHVFDTPTAVALVDRSGFQVLRVDVLRPYDIIISARRRQGNPDNSIFFGAEAQYRRQSPFALDRK